MVTFARTQQATRAGADKRTAMVAEGVDVLVASFTREAVTIAPKAGAVVVASAGRAAQRMKDRVHIDEGDLLDSITADDKPTASGQGVYADAGPDRTVNAEGAFKGPFFEHGTVKMPPDPIVGPAADETMPELAEAIRKLPSL